MVPVAMRSRVSLATGWTSSMPGGAAGAIGVAWAWLIEARSSRLGGLPCPVDRDRVGADPEANEHGGWASRCGPAARARGHRGRRAVAQRDRRGPAAPRCASSGSIRASDCEAELVVHVQGGGHELGAAGPGQRVPGAEGVAHEQGAERARRGARSGPACGPGCAPRAAIRARRARRRRRRSRRPPPACGRAPPSRTMWPRMRQVVAATQVRQGVAAGWRRRSSASACAACPRRRRARAPGRRPRAARSRCPVWSASEWVSTTAATSERWRPSARRSSSRCFAKPGRPASTAVSWSPSSTRYQFTYSEPRPCTPGTISTGPFIGGVLPG